MEAQKDRREVTRPNERKESKRTACITIEKKNDEAVDAVVVDRQQATIGREKPWQEVNNNSSRHSRQWHGPLTTTQEISPLCLFKNPTITEICSGPEFARLIFLWIWMRGAMARFRQL